MKINEKTGLYENYGMWHVPFWQTREFCICMKIFAGIVVAILLVLLYRAYRRHKNKKQSPVWTIALQELHQLKKDKKIDADHGKEFYVTISSVLKRYFHRRFNYDLLGKTDDEVIVYLDKKGCDPALVADIKNIFRGGSIIKFANAKAVQLQIDHNYQLAIAIVKQTIPKVKK